MNALLRELIERGWYDHDMSTRTRSVSTNCSASSPATRRERVARSAMCRRRDLAAAAELIGTVDRLVSTVLQGFYQSHQATAASCRVNNIHLLRGMIGRPGAGVLQMNGQPTAQNNREAGADGDLPGFATGRTPTMFENSPSCGTWTSRRSRTGRRRRTRCRSSATPNRARSSSCGSSPPTLRSRCPTSSGSARSSPTSDLFVVVQDLFMTETAELADIVLPAATWGERTGTFTNADRTVHLSDQGGRPAGRGASGSRHLARFRPTDGFPRPRRRPADRVARRRSRPSRRGRMLARPAVRLQRHDLRHAPSRQRHPMAVHRRAS